MGRRRKTRPDLPQRVYFNHGAYYYAPPVGGRVHLGRDFGPAMAKWAEIVARPASVSTMGEVMDRYMLEISPKKSPRTYQDNIKEMSRLRAVFGHMEPAEITAPDIYAYMDAREAPVRANREKALLSHVFSYAIRWGVAKDNPCRNVKRNTERPRDRYVEDAELEAFKGHAGELLRNYVDFKYLTGLRKGDILKLRLDALTDEGIAVTQAKTGGRLIFLWDAELRAVVDRIRAMPRPIRGLHLFCTRSGQPYAASGFDSIWQRTMQAAIASGALKERFTEHDIRAKTATDDPLNAQRRLGHKSSLMTDRYVKVRKVEKVKPFTKKI
jgi:integrase